MKFPKLAQTLKVISKIGKKALYGPSKTASKFLADLNAAGKIFFILQENIFSILKKHSFL